MTSQIPSGVVFALIGCLVASLAGAAPPDDWRPVRSAALKAARSDDPSVSAKAFEPLLQHDHEDSAELLMKAIASTSSPLALKQHARDVLGTHQSEECRELVFRELRSSPAKSFLLLEAFALMEDERAPEIGKLAMDGSDRSKNPDAITAAAIRCLASAPIPGPEAVSVIFAHLAEDKPIGARLAALDSMPKIRTGEMIAKLIELMDDAALKTRAHLLLVRLAGREAGLEKKHWEDWWQTMDGNVPEDDLMPVEDAEVLMAAGVQAAEEDGSIVSFYGVPIEGQHVLFVLDASSSMRGYPLDKLKGECSSLVTQLPETHHFALLFFPGNDCYPREMLQATEEVKEKAFKFIDKREVIRGTPVIKAMEYGFRRYVEKGNVDAVYLLSDGAPTSPIPKVLATIDDLNAGRYIPIHTIYIGTIPDPAPGEPKIDLEDVSPPKGPIRTGWEFLREVARRHDGKFSVVEL
jgi:hypothetical protein